MGENWEHQIKYAPSSRIDINVCMLWYQRKYNHVETGYGPEVLLGYNNT